MRKHKTARDKQIKYIQRKMNSPHLRKGKFKVIVRADSPEFLDEKDGSMNISQML